VLHQFALCGEDLSAEWTGAAMSENTLELFVLNVHLGNYEIPYLCIFQLLDIEHCAQSTDILCIYISLIFLKGWLSWFFLALCKL